MQLIETILTEGNDSLLFLITKSLLSQNVDRRMGKWKAVWTLDLTILLSFSISSLEPDNFMLFCLKTLMFWYIDINVLFFFYINVFNWRLITLQYCIGFVLFF